MPEGHEALDENHDLPQQCGRSLLLGAMKLVGCYDSMGGRVMPGRSQKECEAGTRNLVHLYERALAEAPQELVKLDEVLHGNGTLSPRFDHNFD